jgi:hypothetical protein
MYRATDIKGTTINQSIKHDTDLSIHLERNAAKGLKAFKVSPAPLVSPKTVAATCSTGEHH